MTEGRVGRPQKAMRDMRRKIVHVRLTDEEYDYIFYKSVREKCSMADVIRRAIFGNFCDRKNK